MKQSFFFLTGQLLQKCYVAMQKMASQTIRLFLAIEFLTVNYELTQNRNCPRGYESFCKF